MTASAGVLLAVALGSAAAGTSPDPAEGQRVSPSAADAPRSPSTANPGAASYAIGLLLGSQLANNGLAASLSRADFDRGIDDALSGKPAGAEQRQAAQQFSRAARLALAERNTVLAHQFLAQNIRRKGIDSLPSGLQYRVLAPGDAHGQPPGPADRVSVRYTASLVDGTELDRSDEHTQPAIFRMNSMITGWKEALSSMRPHAKWQVFVPPELGYGANSPPPIPPGALVVYELELLEIESAGRLPPEVSAPPGQHSPQATGAAPAAGP